MPPLGPGSRRKRAAPQASRPAGDEAEGERTYQQRVQATELELRAQLDRLRWQLTDAALSERPLFAPAARNRPRTTPSARSQPQWIPI